MKISNCIWLVQNPVVGNGCISPKALGNAIRQQVERQDIKVLHPLQKGPEDVKKLLEIDLPHELKRDPKAVFVINQLTVDSDLTNSCLMSFLSQSELIRPKGQNNPCRIILYGLPQDELCQSFTECIESGIVQGAANFNQLVDEVASLIT